MGLISATYLYGFALIVVGLPTWLVVMAGLDRLHELQSRNALKPAEANSANDKTGRSRRSASMLQADSWRGVAAP
jgi:hypothetical protein